MSLKHQTYMFILLVLFLGIHASFSDELESDAKAYSLSLSYSHIPLSISGMEDVHVSDWEIFGTDSMEGRAEVKLSESNTDRNFAAGGTVAIGYMVNRRFGMLLDVPIGFNSKAFTVGAHYGFRFDFVKTNRFFIGIVPKGGVTFINMSSTRVKMLPGKTPPIITAKYTFYEGDKVKGKAIGGAVTGEIVSEFRITSKVSLECRGGYRKSFFGEPKISIGHGDESTTFDISDPEIIEPENNPDETVINAYPTGKVTGQGLVFSVGLKGYYFGK